MLHALVVDDDVHSLSSLADPDTRPIEILVFTTCMTLGCYLLFKAMLHLPIPVLPPLLGY